MNPAQEVMRIEGIWEAFIDGRLLLLEFARKPTAAWVADLFTSIVEGIPVGAITRWSTQVEIEVGQAAAAGKCYNYVLDGYRRVWTFVSIFSGNCPVFFDLESGRFVPRGSLGEEPGLRHLLPCRYLLDPAKMRKELQRRKVTEAEASRVETAANAMLWCRIPIFTLSTENTEYAFDVQRRLNARGVEA